MNTTDTPETDEVWNNYVTPYSRKYAETPIASLTNLARKLERERNTLAKLESQLPMVLGALDTCACALANHDHQWTEGERTIYEMAVEFLTNQPN